MRVKRKPCEKPEIIKMPGENNGKLVIHSGRACFEISLMTFGKYGTTSSQALVIHRSGRMEPDQRYDKVTTLARKILGKKGIPFIRSFKKNGKYPRWTQKFDKEKRHDSFQKTFRF